MRTISIRMPYAWLIVHGYKDIENRDWKTEYRGPLLIHAGKAYTRKAHDAFAIDFKARFDIDLPTFEELQKLLGGIIGCTNLVGCVDDHPSPWKFPDSYGWLLRASRPIPYLPWKGQLGFFDVQLPVEQVLRWNARRNGKTAFINQMFGEPVYIGVDYAKEAAPSPQKHHCHWPDCKAEVPPKMWGCKPHWFALPSNLRARIWATYRPGQEISKTPSPEYLAAAMDVQQWIRNRAEYIKEGK